MWPECYGPGTWARQSGKKAGRQPPSLPLLRLDDPLDLVDRLFELAVAVVDDIIVVFDVCQLLFELSDSACQCGRIFAAPGCEPGAKGFAVFRHQEDKNGAVEAFSPRACPLDVGPDDDIAAIAKRLLNFAAFQALVVVVHAGPLCELSSTDLVLELGFRNEVVVILVLFVGAREPAGGTGGPVHARAFAEPVDDSIFPDAGRAVEDDDQRARVHALIIPPSAACARSCQKLGYETPTASFSTRVSPLARLPAMAPSIPIRWSPRPSTRAPCSCTGPCTVNPS